MLTTPKNARSASKNVDGSGTCEALPIPTELPAAGTARSVLSAAMLLMLVELMAPSPNGPLGVSESAKAIPFG
jgi:hypothetical protein